MTYTVPSPSEGYGGNGVWGSSPAISESLNLVFIGTGNNYAIPEDVRDCLNGLQPGQSSYLCQAPNNYDDSILALNLTTGQVVWNFSAFGVDWFSWNCRQAFDPNACSNNSQLPGRDWDFAQAPMLFKHTKTGQLLVGAASKGGMVFTLDANTGKVVWVTAVGPGSDDGGMLWGSTVDESRIYVALANGRLNNSTLPNGTVICYGSWLGLDIDTGKILWQTPDPVPMSFDDCLSFPYDHPATNMRSGSFGALAGTSDLVFGSSEYGTFYALDKTNGKILWSYASKVYSHSGPILVNDWMYWGVGTGSVPPGYMYAFRLK